MEGLYRGKYLIGFYDKDDFPIFIASTRNEFIEWYCNYFGLDETAAISRLTNRRLNSKQNHHGKVVLIPADEVINDCFEEVDKDFINFINETRNKSMAEIAKEMGISERKLYRLREIGKLDIPRRRKVSVKEKSDEQTNSQKAK